jgi:hypothetical protein
MEDMVVTRRQQRSCIFVDRPSSKHSFCHEEKNDAIDCNCWSVGIFDIIASLLQLSCFGVGDGKYQLNLADILHSLVGYLVPN